MIVIIICTQRGLCYNSPFSQLPHNNFFIFCFLFIVSPCITIFLLFLTGYKCSPFLPFRYSFIRGNINSLKVWIILQKLPTDNRTGREVPYTERLILLTSTILGFSLISSRIGLTASSLFFSSTSGNQKIIKFLLRYSRSTIYLTVCF